MSLWNTGPVEIAGLSQAVFVNKFRIPRRTVEDWCTGEHSPPIYVLYFLAWIIFNDNESRNKCEGI